MAKNSISLDIDKDLYKNLETRAKKNLMSVRELASDILRRSMISYKKGNKTALKIDDALIQIFSRDKRKTRK